MAAPGGNISKMTKIVWPARRAIGSAKRTIKTGMAP